MNYNVKIIHFIFLAKPIDHCITTSSSQTVISNMYVINGIVCSDQFPLCLNIDCDKLPIYNETVANIQRNVHIWQLANTVNLQEYILDTHKIADDIIIPMMHCVVETAIVLYIRTTLMVFIMLHYQ